MNKAIPTLTLICGFLLGVIAGPWLWPRDLLIQSPAPPESSPQTAIQPEVLPVLPAPEAPAAAEATAPAQEESELVLKGVLVGEDAARSRALIAQGMAEPRLYKVDDKLPDGSVLKAVENKQVEVEKDGETLKLTLDRGKPSDTPNAGTASVEANDVPAEAEPAASEPQSPAPVTASAVTEAGE